MDNAKTRGRRQEAYPGYVEDRAIPEGDKVRRERRPAPVDEGAAGVPMPIGMPATPEDYSTVTDLAKFLG
jgi:hypothetical protein